MKEKGSFLESTVDEIGILIDFLDEIVFSPIGWLLVSAMVLILVIITGYYPNVLLESLRDILIIVYVFYLAFSIRGRIWRDKKE